MAVFRKFMNFVSIAMMSCGGPAYADMRNSDFIKANPHSEDPSTWWTYGNGKKMKSPLRIYDADMAILFTLADLKVAQSYTQGSGYEPVKYKTADNQERAVARLYFVNYADTDLGAYHEFILALDTVPEKSQRDSIAYESPESVYQSMQLKNYQVFLDFLILNKADPVHAGRDAWGMNKHLGTTLFSSFDRGDLEGKLFQVSDGNQRPILLAKINLNKLLPEIGRTNLMDSFSAPATVPFAQINFDIREPSSLKGSSSPKGLEPRKVSFVNYNLAWTYRSLRFDGKNDVLRIGDGRSRMTKWQKRLSDLRMRPVVSLYGSRAQFTVN